MDGTQNATAPSLRTKGGKWISNWLALLGKRHFISFPTVHCRGLVSTNLFQDTNQGVFSWPNSGPKCLVFRTCMNLLHPQLCGSNMFEPFVKLVHIFVPLVPWPTSSFGFPHRVFCRHRERRKSRFEPSSGSAVHSHNPKYHWRRGWVQSSRSGIYGVSRFILCIKFPWNPGKMRLIISYWQRINRVYSGVFLSAAMVSRFLAAKLFSSIFLECLSTICLRGACC